MDDPEFSGAFRFDAELDDAPALLAGGLELDAMLSATVPLERVLALASDRRRASKVLIALDTA